ADLYAPTPEHLAACRKRLAELRNDGLFTPPSLRGSVFYPFTGGGANWSGAAFDPARQLLFVPVQNLVHIVKLDEVADRATGGGGAGGARLRSGPGDREGIGPARVDAAPGAARARRAHRRAHRHVRSTRRSARGPDQLQARPRPPAVHRRGGGRPSDPPLADR